ncbi:MAG: hypothetical protein K6D92_04530 [Erysipelotrichaceae bacterium]|nr:hypothetical protein [Erysipelotrichaceae bacterium]
MKKILCVLLIIFLLCGCKAAKTDPIDDNYRVFYQIFVGSFSDSDGDGIGDLKGVLNRLDYLNDGNTNSGKSLGIQGIWLSPVFVSPSYHKYDVVDYYQIDPQFGTEEDLKKLIDECHKRNIIVILDLAINHTSINHEWFKRFAEARIAENKTDAFYDYYTCVTDETKDKGKTYYPIPGTSYYYEGNFSGDMPELNFNNPEVRNEVLNIAKYYIDLGIDGFRFDAAKYIYYADNDGSVDFWQWYISELKSIKPDIYTVGEVWSNDHETISYIKGLNCFNFTMSQPTGAIATAANGGDVNRYTTYVASYIDKIHEINPDSMIIPFISNHDMDRSAGYLNPKNGTAYMAANLYILCSGSPFIYYGEEIGMKGSRGTANTDANRRLAMLWGDNDTVRDPEGSTYGADKQPNGTVAEQLKDKNSLYNYYCSVIAFRNRYPQIARGKYYAYTLNDSTMGGFSIEYNGEISYLFHNTGTEELSYDLSSFEFKPSKIIESIGLNNAKYSNGVLTLGPQTSVLMK